MYELHSCGWSILRCHASSDTIGPLNRIEPQAEEVESARVQAGSLWLEHLNLDASPDAIGH